MSFNTLVRELILSLGVPRNTTSHSEKLISTLGAAVGIVLVCGIGVVLLSGGVLGQQGVYMVVASMGASAVLLFAVPHGALSQPWAVLGGHVVSACIGVTAAILFDGEVVAAAVAVGLAVGAMSYLRCIHPPGGATALTAVIGGAEIHALGFHYVLIPVLLNASVILVTAIAFNWCFRWRRYPAHLFYKTSAQPQREAATREFELTQEDLSAAIHQHDSFVDITEEGLTELLELAKQHAEKNVLHPERIEPGRFYSNGKLGKLWSVRQVIDAAEGAKLPTQDKLIYKVVAGSQAYATDICLREEFKKWARFEVIQKDSRWVKA